MFLDSVDSSASDGRYLELDADANAESPNNELDGLELKKWILTAIEEQVRKNNVLVVGRVVKKAAKNA